MATLFTLPLLGQTMQEGTILKWFKQEGDPVEGWETLFEVMTDKINMEVEPQVSGVLRRILVPEGATVPVGAPVAIIGTADEPIDAMLASLPAPGSGQPRGPAPTAPGENRNREQELDSSAGMELPGAGWGGPPWPPVPGAASEPPAISPRARHRAEEAGVEWRSLSLAGSGYEGMIVERDIEALLREMPAPARVTPLAGRLAAELGVEIAALTGSGPGGKVTVDDVRRAAAGSPPTAHATEGPTAPGAERREPLEIRLTGARKVIAERLGAIYRAAPHVPLRLEIDMTEAVALRAQLLPEVERRTAVRLTITHMIARAVVVALADHPRLSSTLEEDVLRIFPAVHLGIAVALDEGLLVPVVHEADRLSLPELVRRAHDLADRARRSALKPDELSGGTFTITNLGSYGVESFDPILNPPQVAILGIGRIVPRLVPRGEGTATRQMMAATLVFDHRALDGAPAARFLARLKELLEAPASILL
jgi:pyruvate dehydrogenase E2 component (dihydrolipoamide acetyltransferase)